MQYNDYPLYDVQKVSSIREMIELAVRDAGENIAYKFKENDTVRQVTFREFADTVYSLGAFLKKENLSDKHIACIGINSYNWIVTYMTALRGEGVFVPIDKDLPEDDIIHLICDSESEVIFYSGKFEEFLSRNKDRLNRVRYFIGFDRKENDGRFLSFSNALEIGEKHDKTDFLKEHSGPDKLKLLVYTSGTTGDAKGVMLSEHNLVSSVYHGLRVSRIYDTGLSVLPYHHTYEAVSDILVSFHNHSTLCINESLASIMKNMIIYKPSYIYIVPAIAESMYKRIMKSIRKNGMQEQFASLVELSNKMLKDGIDKRREFFGFIHDTFGGRLIKIVCGGAPIRTEVAEFFDNVGFDFINGYGITECSPLVCANHDRFNNPKTVGIRLPCIELKIDSPDKDGIGEICVRGDVVMLGYYNNPALTTEALRDGWFYTGDYGYINGNDQLVISGRKKNLIVLNNGKNICPEEIESYIQNIDCITEAVVFSLKDEDGIETSLYAEVYIEEGVKEPKEVLHSIRKACIQLPQYKQISKVIIRDSAFPKTSSNKIKRQSTTIGG